MAAGTKGIAANAVALPDGKTKFAGLRRKTFGQNRTGETGAHT